MVKQFWFLVLLFVCLGLLTGGWQIREAKATLIERTITFSSLPYDGTIHQNSTSYIVTHNYIYGDIDTTGETMRVEQIFDIGFYYIYRSFVFFDTSIIPDNANILNATLSLYLYLDRSDVEFNVVIQNGQPYYPHIPMVDTDYYYLQYRENGGTKYSANFSLNAYNNITLNAAGMSWLNLGGITKLCLRSDKDIAAAAPTTDKEGLVFYTSEKGSAYAPKLYVTYQSEVVKYIVYGPYYEDGRVANCITNVTLYSQAENPYSFILNGTDGTADSKEILYDQAAWYFQWNASNTMTRNYYLGENDFVEVWVYVANPLYVYGEYAITFTDLAGILNSYPYVSVQKYIGDSMKVVERQKVDVEGKVSFFLEEWSSYTIRLESSSNTYVFGDLLAGANDEIGLTLRGVEFPKETLFTQSYIRIYGLRSFGANNTGNITVTYQDLLHATESVQIIIKYRNGTVAYSATLTTDTFIMNWQGANNTLDYSLTATITHATYGTYSWKQYFPRQFSEPPPWSLAWLGTLGFNTAIIIPALIIIFAGACFSILNVAVGAFATVIVAIILSWMGWIPIPPAFLMTALILAVLLAITIAKSRSVSE